MGKVRKQHAGKTKLEAAILMASGKCTVAELCQKYEVNQSVLQRWKKELLSNGSTLFSRSKKAKESGYTADDFQRTIGQLTMELEFAKKALGK